MMKKETTLPRANAELAAEYSELMEKYEDFDFMYPTKRVRNSKGVSASYTTVTIGTTTSLPIP